MYQRGYYGNVIISSVARGNLAKIPIKKNNYSGRDLNVTNLVRKNISSLNIYMFKIQKKNLNNGIIVLYS